MPEHLLDDFKVSATGESESRSAMSEVVEADGGKASTLAQPEEMRRHVARMQASAIEAGEDPPSVDPRGAGILTLTFLVRMVKT
jgi:hypothetical protein